MTASRSSNAERVVARSTQTTADLQGQVDTIAPRFAFDYLQLLGLIGALGAVATLALHRSMGRRERALARTLTRRMGMKPRSIAVVSVLEVGVITAVALVAALVAAPQLTQRVAPRFDPAPRLPPAIEVDVSLSTWTWAAAGLAVVALMTWLIEWRTNDISDAEVLRGSD